MNEKKTGQKESSIIHPTPTAEKPRVTESDLRLVEGKGTKKFGGGPKGFYWHIYVGEKRAGRVFINWIETSLLPLHASITVELNVQCRGKGIGTIAFRQACELSRYNEVYASIRKGNIASRIAAGRAGFKPVENWEGRELLMVWKRNKQDARKRK